MAGIKSLAVRGIRSFGPEECDEQRITFEKPLTLILGQNGCGKTTIIECLRYAITGQMPPGSRYECFVHDTKVNRSVEVMAQVKLKIVNAKDKLLEVSRSMKVTALKNKKPKFQTLDSFLSVDDGSGKTKDISSRCADLDFVMHEELGVSKAILNSVIFCHQEDSSWPLDEGKKVKERFDEIFDADKYSDCFDRLRKIRKEYEHEIKSLGQQVSYWTEKKEDLDKKKLDLVNTKTRMSEAEEKILELSTELRPISEKLNAIETLQKNLVSFESAREKIKNRLEHHQDSVKELMKSIDKLYEGSTEELHEKYTNYGATIEAKHTELDKSYKQNFSFNKEEERIANEKTNNEVKFNKLILLESQNQEKIDRRNNMVLDTAKLADVEVQKIETDGEADQCKAAVMEKIKDLMRKLEQHKLDADKAEKEYQKHVDDSRDALSRHKQKISNKETEIQTVKKEIMKMGQQITDANKSKQRLEILDAKLKTAEEEYEQTVKEVNTEESQNEINCDEKVMENYEHELEQLNEKVTKLQNQSTILKEKDMIEESLKQKEKQLNVLKNKHRSAITELLGKMIENNFAISINQFECQTRTELETIKKNISEKQNEITRVETDRDHINRQLRERREELSAAEDRMYRECGAQTYDNTLAKITATVDKLQDEQNVLQSSMFIITKYKGQIKDNNCCPLCSRGFDNEDEVNDLISQLTTQVMNVPAKLEKVTEELQRTSAKKDNLLSMRSLNERIVVLKEKDIPDLEKRLVEADKVIASLTESVDDLTMLSKEPEQKMSTLRQIQGDMPLLDKFTNEIRSSKKDLESVKAKCADFEFDISLDTATVKQTDLRQKIGILKTKIKSNQTKLNEHTKKIQKQAEEKNKLKEELLNIQKMVQELYNLQETLKQMESNKEKYSTELKELEDSTEKLEMELKEKEKAKNNAVTKNRHEIQEASTYLTRVSNAFDKIKAIDSEIKQHKDRNIQKEMDQIKEANDRLNCRHKQIINDRDTLTKKIDSLKDEIAKQEIYKRTLEDNIKLRKAETEIESCNKELVEINDKLKGVNTDMISEKEPLIMKQTKIFREKAQTEGQLEELKKVYKQNQLELKKAQNQEVEKKYKEKLYELHVTKAIDADIRDYSIALDKCLMEFHKEKMENINLIIRELWRKIYRGNDIDYIEIKTEGSMSAESERRKYDYRVVQCKNGVEIDMRGRCSAGQKVLACLIIRLALAETFSSRFGILALDEPTTNLDQENVVSLCSALGDIVQERMSQRNFMFIIITHDREFIDTLGNIDKVTHYYEVSRNEEGKSRVKKIRFT